MEDLSVTFGVFLFTVPIYLLCAFGFQKLFEKAGQPGWHAFVPVLNTMTLLRITGRKQWEIILDFVPILNVFQYVRNIVDLVRCFGEERMLHKTVAVLFGWVYLPWFAMRPFKIGRAHV